MIDFNKRLITGKSRKYKIEPENLTVGRYQEWVMQANVLAWNTDFQTLYNDWQTILQLSSSGNDVLGAISKIYKLAEKNTEGIKNFVNNDAPKIIKYCTLFCNYEGEDCSKYDPVVAMEKYNDWANIPIVDFFSLAAKATPLLPQTLRSTLGKALEKEEKLI